MFGFRGYPVAPGGILLITDRRFWRRSSGSEERIATLVGHLASAGEHICVAYVGRIQRAERKSVAKFISAHPTLSVRARSLGPRRNFVQAAITKTRPRVVIVEFLRLTYTVHPRPRPSAQSAETVYWIDTHDVVSRRNESFRAASQTPSREITRAKETRDLATYDVILAIQDTEAGLFRDLVPNHPVVLVPHGLKIPERRPDRRFSSLSIVRLGFLGGRDISNSQSLHWFSESIWPEIRSRFGHRVELHVAGPVCESFKTNSPGIVIEGFVNRVGNFWGSIDIAINPIQFGSGLKIKNVEALAFGCALLTTALGAEGMEGASPFALRIASGDSEWKKQLGDWLSNPESIAVARQEARGYADTHLTEHVAFRALRHALLHAQRHTIRSQLAETASESAEQQR